ncbi:hypothetical protein L1987_59560 [Smallanthus sonchifolius]|uniref:Uncharacterized protein n=1 Tax=Smallanthus sonchifolius TaxID=185202 RepID=A0ACB9D6F4_9ASTR|nr:hypothetical protein L1987_59560 [Smallanthus sonchifolius]
MVFLEGQATVLWSLRKVYTLSFKIGYLAKPLEAESSLGGCTCFLRLVILTSHLKDNHLRMLFFQICWL